MAKKRKSGCLPIIIVIIVIIAFIWMLPDYEKNIENQGTDTMTVMLYMCGADLESEDGSASEDLHEIVKYAAIDEKVNVIVQTGGSSEWQDYKIASDRCQRYKVENHELELIDDSLGQLTMTDPYTLSDFIKYCKKNYSADRYALIMWDHGGGVPCGYGYDENSDDPDDPMSIDELQKALNDGNVHFDFIGFDACLMASVENAYALRKNADYLVASEETEPGTGWDYEDVFDTISSNTSAPTVDIAKSIVDSFIADNNYWGDDATLSVIDLSKMENVYDNLCSFASTIEHEDLTNAKSFSSVSKAIKDTKAFGEGEFDTIDLYNLAENVNNSQSKKLISSLDEAIVYNKTTDIVENSHGLSVYIPYYDLSYYDDVVGYYKNVGIGYEYTTFLGKFVNILASGKRTTTDKMGNLVYVDDFTSESWYSNEYSFDYNLNIDLSNRELIDKGDYYALSLTGEEWQSINAVTVEVLYDDGNGYIDLGSDDYFETDSNGDLMVTFDGYWISIDGQTVPYYAMLGEDTYKGTVPCLINDELCELIIVFDDDGNATISGYKLTDSYGDSQISSRVKDLQKGDVIQFVCDYYTYKGEYVDSYILGDEIVYKGKELKVEYMEVEEEAEFLVYYKLVDIYNNEYYTEAVTIEY